MAALTNPLRTCRFIFFNLLSWLTVIPFAILVLLAWPFGHQVSYYFARQWALTVLLLARYICGLRYKVVGQENIPSQSSVYCIKHSSAFETFGAVAMFPRHCWVLKKELLLAPFFGWALLPLNAIAIDRSKGGAAVSQVITQGKNRLQRGISVVVFPEGTRMPIGTTKRYGISGVLLAQESGALIVPVAHNAGYFWPRRGLGITPGEITVVIGRPVNPAGRDPRELNEEIQGWVETQVAELLLKD
ncbi:MAG: 1-acyl-sn-glycerol-3-phosphate acyltransferase [Gammaproteobacteria bacterium]|nr:1-acyl-sn-glycerol-3-phosphate acyltransferase [Gammaproteobacteria bacterium]MCP4090895.1 1-acyl-sn-glycerol-3-phosphate acyltransferase [Gammaproteobacteria bacterium]MCP4275182.1 1-acyl-sn-glycerol-3-phosphate acyltransferase [Gammaproteobacteria bacterium]MCP4830808.1 1-acyl-sn-glycerol-3-phosphate acyltransferase [Gammaproteobacteria bacterium]MCP4929597.1 1-acyl-sn-glycerol-3-phosphate acyltransferase [Gammaproteobacteria bacterium]